MGSSPTRVMRADFSPSLAAPMAIFAGQPPTAFAKVATSSSRLPICCPYRSTLTRPIVMRSSGVVTPQILAYPSPSRQIPIGQLRPPPCLRLPGGATSELILHVDADGARLIRGHTNQRRDRIREARGVDSKLRSLVGDVVRVKEA